MDLLQSIKTTGRKLERAVSHRQGTVRPDDKDILDTLKQEHDEVGAMLKKLVAADNSAERK